VFLVVEVDDVLLPLVLLNQIPEYFHETFQLDLSEQSDVALHVVLDVFEDLPAFDFGQFVDEFLVVF